MAGAAKVYRGEYRTSYVYHAQMEPMNATAVGQRPTANQREVWCGMQSTTGAVNTSRRAAADRAVERSSTTSMLIGGGFGRRGQRRGVVHDAVGLSKR